MGGVWMFQPAFKNSPRGNGKRDIEFAFNLEPVVQFLAGTTASCV